MEIQACSATGMYFVFGDDNDDYDLGYNYTHYNFDFSTRQEQDGYELDMSDSKSYSGLENENFGNIIIYNAK